MPRQVAAIVRGGRFPARRNHSFEEAEVTPYVTPRTRDQMVTGIRGRLTGAWQMQED